MTKDNGGSAFPHQADKEFLTSGVVQYHPGMTLRDWFASQAIAGVMGYLGDSPTLHPDVVADASYCLADAMIRARDAHLRMDMPIQEPMRSKDGGKA